MDDQTFRQLLNHLELSWRGYRKVRKGVKKRVARHMQQLGCRTMEAYLAALNTNQAARNDCMRLMTVSISRFFRDKKLWSSLETDILPEIIAQHSNQVSVWSAGCARGEEVYTFKMVWDMLKKHKRPLPELVLWATDVNSDYLEKAQRGIYNYSSLREMPESLRDHYFQVWRKEKSWQIIRPAKEGIQWLVRDLSSPPPGQGFHIVFLRNNLLTYFQDTIKVPAFKHVVSSLAEGGYLVIGAHEKIPPGFLLQPTGIHPCIFEKQGFGC